LERLIPGLKTPLIIRCRFCQNFPSCACNPQENLSVLNFPFPYRYRKGNLPILAVIRQRAQQNVRLFCESGILTFSGVFRTCDDRAQGGANDTISFNAQCPATLKKHFILLQTSGKSDSF